MSKIQKYFTEHNYMRVPVIAGAKGGKGGSAPVITPNSLFSTDILFMLIGLGEGPVYRINPNGAQDIQIQDSTIDDLINLYGDGGPNTNDFYYIGASGTTTQGPLPYFGDEIVSPQSFGSPVRLKKGNVEGVPASKVTLQETSADAWDSIRFNFAVDSLLTGTEKGDVLENSLTIAISLFDRLGNPIPLSDNSNSISRVISGKTDTAFKTSISIAIPEEYKSTQGYRFTVEKTSDDSNDSRIFDDIRFFGWDEIKNEKLAYPRTALLGLALKAVNEHQGGVPNFTSWVKGLLVKVPSNYNQPILAGGEIDWREVEVPSTGDNGLTTRGYRLQSSGTAIKYDQNPEIYKGVWDGSFTYSWTQNPVWIIYDILTNKTYGLGIPEQNIDKYKFYKVGMYCDACDFTTGRFVGVDGLADGSFRSKPLGMFTEVLENQVGLPSGTAIKERRFICDISISDQKKAIDILNDIAAAIRSIIIYSGGKITLATDMPDEYPAMIFNEANIKKGSLSISGYKLSDVLTGVDIAYIEPTNHFTREVINLNVNELNRGDSLSETDNISNLDLAGVTRRSQAMRAGQYYLASSRYQKRFISFTTSTQALYLSPGDLISVATTGSSINYGFGGRIFANSAINTAGDTSVYLEHFTSPAIANSDISGNTYPLALRVTKQDTDRTDLYILSNTEFDTSSVYSSGTDNIRLEILEKYDPITKTFVSLADRYATRLVATETNVNGGFLNATSTLGAGTYTFSTYVEGSGWFKLRSLVSSDFTDAAFAWFNLDTGSLGSVGLGSTASVISSPSATISPFGTGYRVTLTYTTGSTASIANRLYLVDNNAFLAVTVGKSVVVEAPQLQTGSVATDFVVGGVNILPADPINILSGAGWSVLRLVREATQRSLFAVLEANTAPIAGDLWSLGEIVNPANFYTSKAGRLFKVTEIRRESDQETNISAVEYIPEVYEDSDSFIDYDPVPYLDFVNYFEPPPVPKVSVSVTPRSKPDGSITADARIFVTNDVVGNRVQFTTEYFISRPTTNVPLSNAWGGNPLQVSFPDINTLANGTSVHLQGKNGFTTRAGAIKLLCNAYSITDLSNITLTVEGLSSCQDLNFGRHVLEVNDGEIFGVLKGTDAVTVPVNASNSDAGLLNFVGYASRQRSVSREILGYSLSNNTITIEDTVSGTSKLFDVIPPAPFYITISQVLESDYYDSKTFYVDGAQATKVVEGTISGASTIELPLKPRSTGDVRFYVDGILKNQGQYTLNLNKNSSLSANVLYTALGNEISYRLEADYYLPPAIEIGDTVQITANTQFTVTNTSYDVASIAYSNALTSNSIFRIELDSNPSFSASGSEFINITPNPEGVIANITGSTGTFDYNRTLFPGAINLANTGIYTLNVSPTFYEPFVPNEDSVLKELPLGLTTIRVRNKNFYGRTSRYVEKTLSVEPLPIQKVENIQIIESLYREQSGGVSVRATIEFDHIQGQEVTDYEISYKIANVQDELGKNTTGITSFNTVKLPASGSDNGVMRFTLNNIDRGTVTGANTLTVKVTPLNRDIRGKTTTIEQTIEGKTVAPDNIFNFTGGQQNDLITLFWSYPRVGDQLKDLDLKEIVIRRIEGAQEATLENFAIARPLATVSVGSSRKSIPIDTFGTFTYLARTRDTSDILSEGVVGVTLTTTRPQRSTIIAAYSEDDPSVSFAGVPNDNASESKYPSFNDSNTGGLAYSYTSAVDNANGSSSGWSSVFGNDTDLLADAEAEYITQIRDIGTTVTASIAIDIVANQAIQATYNDQKTLYLSGTTEVSSDSTVLVDVDFGGIGHVLGSANVSVPFPRYDANNKTWMTGGSSGNVWAIWNPGQFVGDTANANSYALIAGLVNANAIKLGATYYANGEPTGSNALANLTQVASNYQLVNLLQYSDVGALTYQGDLGAVFSQTFIRTSTSESLFYANGNVNISEIDNYTVDDGWIPYEAGSRTFRYFQVRYRVFNNDPESYDLLLDKFNYTINKEQTITSNTISYSSSPTTVDYTSQGYLRRPVVSYAVLDQIDAEANPVIAVSTAVSNQSLSFKLFASNGTGEYNANNTANVMITIVGV